MQSYESLLNGDLNWALLEGSMHFEGASAVHRTLKRLANRLEPVPHVREGVDYAIAGDMALFFHGFRRFSESLEVLVTPEGLKQIHAALDGLGYVRPFEKSKNLRDAETGVKIDFLVTGQYPGDGKPGPTAFPDPAAVSEVIEGTHVVELPRLIELKLASGSAPGRLKDLADVQELIQTLDLPKDFSQGLEPTLQETFNRLWDEAHRQRKDEE
jgi:hypothetical protein